MVAKTLWYPKKSHTSFSLEQPVPILPSLQQP